MAAYVYDKYPNHSNTSMKIQYVVREQHKENSPLAITSFVNIIRFPLAAPHLARLLNAGNIWTVNLEKVYSQLVKSRLHHVCYLYFILLIVSLHHYSHLFFVAS